MTLIFCSIIGRAIKKLTGGLDAYYSMNRGYVGAQPIMRESTIKEHDGYLGMHLARRLNVGDTQSFVFTVEACRTASTAE
jgi:hypothetical protein